MNVRIFGVDLDLPLDEGESLVSKYGLWIMLALVVGVVVVLLAVFGVKFN